MAGKLSAKKEEAIVKEAKEAADSWFNYFKENNVRFNEQMKFWLTPQEQWSPNERSQMTAYNKIPLVCPKIYGIGRRIIGEQRQATPDLQVRSITEKASSEEMALLEDMVRTISCHSNAKVAYQTIFNHLLYGGYGVGKVVSEYEKPNGFEQCLRIKVHNEPTTAFFDPAAKEVSKCDGLFSGEYLGMSRKGFEKEFGEIDVPEYETLPLSGYNISSKDQVCIIIYQRKEFFKKKLVQLASGEVMELKQYEEALNAYIDESLMMTPGVKVEQIAIPEQLKVVKKRTSSDFKIRTYKIAGTKVLEHSTWPSKYFSYVFVDGDSHYVDGRQITRTFFQDAKDLQVFGNYLFTQIAHLVKAQRNELWLASPANVSGFEDIWNNPDLTQSVLLANPDQNRGNVMPTQVAPPQISPSLVQQYEKLMMDINTTLGIYDAYEGNSGRETSGVAIDNRVKQGNIATFITFSNLNRGIGQIGSIVLDAIPKVYDTTREMSLKTRDGSTRNVTLNNPQDGMIKNDTSGEDYYIEIDAGASFEGQRIESLMALKDLLQLSPQISNLVADLYAENLSLPNNQVLVKRLRAGFVPPEIVAAGNGEELPPKEPSPPPPELELMKGELQLREQRNQNDAQNNQDKIAIEQEKVELEKQKADFNEWVQAEKLAIDKLKVGLYP